MFPTATACRPAASPATLRAVVSIVSLISLLLISVGISVPTTTG